MRIAVSGTHCMGKSTFIEDFIKKHPEYRYESEPYYQLQDEDMLELSLKPSLESLLEQLDYSIQQMHHCADEHDVIFDRCPVDFIAYSMYITDKDEQDINDSEVADRFYQVKEALDYLDLIVFFPYKKASAIEYTGEYPMYRKKVDGCFKKIYRDDKCDIFPRYGQPRIIEISGSRIARVKKVESYLD